MVINRIYCLRTEEIRKMKTCQRNLIRLSWIIHFKFILVVGIYGWHQPQGNCDLIYFIELGGMIQKQKTQGFERVLLSRKLQLNCKYHSFALRQDYFKVLWVNIASMYWHIPQFKSILLPLLPYTQLQLGWQDLA